MMKVVHKSPHITTMDLDTLIERKNWWLIMEYIFSGKLRKKTEYYVT
jgi:hypothetical protein